jgi:malyl-CoA/(S)-citramalyl-CoA lyase
MFGFAWFLLAFVWTERPLEVVLRDGIGAATGQESARNPPRIRAGFALAIAADAEPPYAQASVTTGSSCMKAPRRYFNPLAIGAPRPLIELPSRLERMIHFVPPHNEKVRAKVDELVGQVDVVLGNLEDAVPTDAKEAAREGLIALAKATDFGSTGLWARVNALNSPWFIDDMTRLVGEIGDKLDVVMIPKVEGDWDIHFVDQYLALLEARYGLKRPILVHAILETAEGVNNVVGVAAASPRMQGMSLGPADLAASRAMKTTRVGGGHPGYRVLGDPTGTQAERASAQQDPWHYTIARMVDACAANGIKPFYGPFGDFSDAIACEAQFRNAFLLGCAGAWTLHPSQIAIAKRVFSPDPAEVAFARKILAAMPDGSGAVMIDGKMQDDATWKQARVVVDLAREVAAKDPDYAALYQF